LFDVLSGPRGIDMNAWHIVWTTRNGRFPSDRKGDWRELRAFYRGLDGAEGKLSYSEPLPEARDTPASLTETVVLNAVAQNQLRTDLTRLCAEGGDRVAGNAPLLGLRVERSSVQLVFICPAQELSQRVGRLKSRTSTLLSFSPEAEAGGKGTWSTGFWWAELKDRDVLDRVVDFVGLERF